MDGVGSVARPVFASVAVVVVFVVTVRPTLVVVLAGRLALFVVVVVVAVGVVVAVRPSFAMVVAGRLTLCELVRSNF